MWIIISIILVSSCTKVGTHNGPAALKYPVLFSADTQPETKISVNGTSVSWEDSDILQITAVSQDGKRAVSDLSVYSLSNSGKTASFTGYVTMESEPENCYFTYPAGNAMSVEDGKVIARFNEQDGTHRPFLYSHAPYNPEGIEGTLKFAGATLEITVNVKGVCSLAFFGNKFEDMYPLIIDPQTGTYSKSEEMGYIIQVPVQSESPTYICVPTVKFEDGFSVVLVDANGYQMVRSFSDGKTGGYDFSDKGGHIIPITINTINGTFERFDVKCTLVKRGHTIEGNILKGTTFSFNLVKTGMPNARIEEWGATVYDSNDNLVRSYRSTGEINGETVTLGVENNWPLLPEGKYYFSSYYKAYGQKVTVSTEEITILDPNVTITLGGYTSYDKYINEGASSANSVNNMTIYNLSSSVNVDYELIKYSYTASLNGGIVSASSWSGSSLGYGNKGMSSVGTYRFEVNVRVGNLEFSQSRDFHITGLPMEVNFNTANPFDKGWVAYNGAKYSDSRVTFPAETWSSLTSSVKSPPFYVPDKKSINVISYADVCCKKSSVKLYVNACNANATSPIAQGNYIQPHEIGFFGSLEPRGYIREGVETTLSGDNKYIMFTANDVPVTYNCGLYKVKMLYK